MFKRSFFYRYLSPFKWKISLNVFLRFMAAMCNILLLLGIAPFLSLLFGQAELVEKPATTAISSENLMNYLKYFVSQSIVHNGHSKTLVYIIVIIGGLYLLKNAFSYLGVYLFTPIRTGVLERLRNDLNQKLLVLPLSFFSGNRKGDIISRMSSDIQEIDNSILSQIQQLLIDFLMVITMLIALIFLSYKLTLVVLLVLPLSMFLTSLASKRLKKTTPEVQQQNSMLISQTEESLGGLKVIKSFNAIDYSKEKFEAYNDLHTKTKMKVARRVTLGSPLSELLGTISIMVVLVFGAGQILQQNNALAPEAFITYILFLVQIVNPMKNLSLGLFQFQQGKASVKRIKYILYAEERIVEKENAVPINSFEKAIEFKNTTFAYDDSDIVVNNLNFTINKGEYAAIVGPSGAGKSTILDLIPRFYDATSGDILIDGISVKDLKIDMWRELSAVVSQDTVLFNDTVFNNIAYGKIGASQEEVVEAAKVANAHDFIMHMENGYQTVIGDAGMKLSGGQRQRLSIARGVLKNAPILILDEATSALDTQSETLVQEAINKLSENRTTIAVAHRISTIKHADKIFVMDKGNIIQQGTHQELINTDGLYKMLAEVK